MSAAQGVHFDNICRTCLAEEQNMKSVFDIDNSLGETLQLFEMLMTATSVQVQEDDGLPAQICLTCINHLARSFCFKKLCEDSDATLREVLRQSTLTDNDDESISEQKPSVDVASCSREAVADVGRDLLDVKIEFEEGLTTIGALISATEYVECKNDNIQMMENAYDAAPPTLQYANSKDTKANTKEDPMRDESDDEPLYSCIECNACFTVVEDLKTHSASHRKVDEYAQAQEKAGSNTLQGHLNYIGYMRAHPNDKKFTCARCDKRFSCRRDLICHQQTHTVAKDHVCPYCKKGFSNASVFHIHKRTHTGKKKYNCNVCNKGFLCSSHLTDYLRRHNGERPYVCSLCHKSYASSSDLRKHMRMHAASTEPHSYEGKRRRRKNL